MSRAPVDIGLVLPKNAKAHLISPFFTDHQELMAVFYERRGNNEKLNTDNVIKKDSA
jgi:hypothetical protein